MQSTLPRLEETVGPARRQGKKSLKEGRKALDLSEDFFSKLLTGDRTTVTQTLAPEIQAVKDQYDATKRSISEYGPRGGGQVAAIGSLEQAEAGDIGRLFSSARSRGAQGEAAVGQALGSLGLGGLGVAQGGIGQILQTLISEQGIEAGITERKQHALGGLGSLIGSFIPLP